MFCLTAVHISSYGKEKNSMVIIMMNVRMCGFFPLEGGLKGKQLLGATGKRGQLVSSLTTNVDLHCITYVLRVFLGVKGKNFYL